MTHPAAEFEQPAAREAAAISGTPHPPLTLGTKLLYGLGSMATGINLRTSSVFLMLFYNQAMGLPAATVAGVITIATMFDAVVDPIVGQFSDNLRSRWGRRHPLMYLSAIPVAVTFYLIWSPPQGLPPSYTAGYLLACLLVLRFCDTLFELPSVSLAPELTADYAQRTELIAMRRAFEMAGGYLMILAGYQLFMRPAADGSGGLQSSGGYSQLGLVGALVIFGAIAVSAFSTHRFIPFLSLPPVRKMSFRAFFGEALQTLNNKAFLIIAASGATYATGVGITQSLQVYLNLYFWGLTQGQVAFMATIQIPASLVGVALAPVLVRQFGKKATAIVFPTIALIATLTSPSLRLAGVLPGTENPILFPYLCTEAVISQVLFVIGISTIPSMVADVVEDNELRTGRRAEGLVFSADNMARKFVSSLGVLVAGLILSWVSFPTHAKPGAVDQGTLDSLIMFWMASITLLLGGSFVLVGFFPITKARHEQNVRKLAERAAGVAPAEAA